MQISFDPSNPDERKIIRTVLAGFDAEDNPVTAREHADMLEFTRALMQGDPNSRIKLHPQKTLTGPADIYAAPLTPPEAQAASPNLAFASGDKNPLGLAPDDRRFEGDTRNPAEVFAPLAVAPSTAAATALPSAPVGLPVGGVQGATAPLPLAPVAPATVAPLATAQTASPASGVEVDKNGLPWDARIHSSSKSKTQQGVWTRRRGLNDDAMVARVEAELRQLMALPAGAAPLQPGPNGTLPLPPVAPVIPAPVLPPVAASMPVAPVLPPVVATAAAPTTLDQLLPLCTAAETAGTMPKGALVAACQAHQLSSPVALAARADYVPVIYAYLKQQYPGFGG